MRVAVVSKDNKPLMPTTPARCRKLLRDGAAEKHWSKEGVFFIKMLVPTGEKTQDVCLAVDPGSRFDGYAVAGTSEVILQGMAVLPKLVSSRMKIRHALRHNRRRRKCRRRKARFDNRKRSDGWIAPSQLAKVQLRIRLIARLARLFPISDIVIEDARFYYFKQRFGFATVQTGKLKVYAAAETLAELRLCEGWETAQARKDYGIEKCDRKSKLAPESHANDALAMICWLFGEKPTSSQIPFYVWRRQECSKRQLHYMVPAKGGKRGNYGGTTSTSSHLRKGDVVQYRGTIAYVGGWARNGKIVALTGADGKRIRQAGYTTVNLVARSSHVLCM